MDYCLNKNDFHFTVADNGVSTLAPPSLGEKLIFIGIAKEEHNSNVRSFYYCTLVLNIIANEWHQ